MSLLFDMMHDGLAHTQELLEGDLVSLEETQGALINAIRHIRDLEGLVQNLQRDLNYMRKSSKGGAA